MARPLAAVCAPPAVCSRGFTLTEVLVAFVLLGWGALAIVGLTATLVRAVAAAERQTLAVTAARTRVEQLASGDCSSLAAGAAADSTRGLHERWVVIAGRHGMRLISDTVAYVERGLQRRVAADRLVIC